MSKLSLDKEQLKETLKIALFEVIQENKAEFLEVLTEAIEDISLAQAIEEGEMTELVDREIIFKQLSREL